MRLISLIDSALNRITMYRLVLYYVVALLAVSFGFGFVQLVPHDPTALTFSAFIILATCWATNRAICLFLKIPANVESVYITALILVLIMPPVVATNLVGVAGLVLASFVAIASKFLLAIKHKHVFNPVAIGVAASALALDQPATWWVGGNLTLLPLVLLGGLLIVRKVQRFDMLGVYIFANLAVTMATTAPDMYGEALSQSLLYSPLLFAGFAMLTEPLTAPHAKWQRLGFGALIGALSSPNVHIGSFYFTPEIAFLVGNIFAYVVSPKGRFKLTLLGIEKVAADCYDFVFHSNRALAHEAGQYLDWTMHVPNPDDRGNRRAFTIASAPNEREVRLGVKFYQGASAYKQALATLKPGDVIYGSQLAGEFTLPKDTGEKLAFIAGGIGVTPFRSIVKDLLNRQEQRDIVMLYGNNKLDEVAYACLFDEAAQIGLKIVHAVNEDAALALDGVHFGFIDADLIRREVPDFATRTFYISGPRAMVTRFQSVLKELGVPRTRIKTDYFPGFA